MLYNVLAWMHITRLLLDQATDKEEITPIMFGGLLFEVAAFTELISEDVFAAYVHISTVAVWNEVEEKHNFAIALGFDEDSAEYAEILGIDPEIMAEIMAGDDEDEIDFSDLLADLNKFIDDLDEDDDI